MKKSGLLALLILCVISMASFGQDPDNRFKMVGNNAQSILINQNYTETVEIFPFGQIGKPIYGLDATADIKLNNENSLIRLLLLDNNFNEYLIYESYNLLLEGENTFSIKDICEETSILDGVIPYALQIEIENAQLKLKSINYSTSIDSGLDIEKVKKEKKKDQNEVKIKKINTNLQKQGKHWVAGPTSVSELSYGQRKKLYGQSTFPAGFEYYSGGVILASSTEDSSTTDGTLKSATTTSPYVGEWDWRNRHGRNWITSVKDQAGCGSCWAFSTTAATEAVVNVYFNQQLNLDLSEQNLVSCSDAGDCGGGYPNYALDYITSVGTVDEETFPYSSSDESCSSKNTTASELIKISGTDFIGSFTFPQTEDAIKKMLINFGPLSSGVYNWAHTMVMIGYKVVEAGDQFFSSTYGSTTIEIGDPLIGKTVWIFKNSWGTEFGDAGYIYVDTDLYNLGWTETLKTPIISEINDYEVVCEDRDGDGYYWWGLGEKPANCPGPDLADGDDSDATKGPLDEYGYCMPLGGTAAPVANFSASKTSANTNETVSFSDLSTNTPTSWSWTFEGGSPATSTTQNPGVTYSSAGTYKVSLTASNADGSDTKSVDNYITVTEPIIAPVADFSASPRSLEKGGTVTFSDLSLNNPTSWSWTFEGGYPATSTAQNPTVTYNTSGSYQVTLITTNAGGSDTKTAYNYIEVTEPVVLPVADFSANKTIINTGESVSFSDLSSDATARSWTFEGGSPATSTEQNPVVTYYTSGTYKVTITATNADGSDTKTVDNYITVSDPVTVILPTADFAANKTVITTGESLNFSDLSSDATSWSWTFEGADKTSSTLQNPSVSYSQSGTYNVSLTATNTDGSDTKTIVDYIQVNEPVILPVADFAANKTVITTGESVNFSDLSSDATSWSWTFEGADKTSSTLQNPSVTYSKSGTYNVSLTATNTDGSDTKTIVDYIQVNEPVILPVADFVANKTVITTGESVNFSDLSSDATSWSWTFEGADKTSSTLQNPSITYSTAGLFNVSLTATNVDGSDTKTIIDYIQVNEPVILPVADFTANKTVITTGESVNFSDLSSDATSWSWTFEGADKTSSTLQNPSVTYSQSGTYNVSLTAINADGSDTKTIVDYIEVKQPIIAPVAEFSADKTTITEGETIAFTDLSSNEPSTWSWTFEGGTPGTSTQQNPSVTYPAAGTYSVTLATSNAGGSDTKTATGYIKVEEYVPSYCIPTASAIFEWIAGVNINGQSKTSGSNGYSDFTAFGFDLGSGTSQSITLTPGFSSRSKFEYWAVWIDFDQDMIFSDAEKILSSSKSKSEITESFSIPSGLNITTRMRVAMSPTAPTACNDLTGEIEDYTVRISEPAPVADFTASSTNVTVGESIQFTNTSLYNPTSLLWNFDSNYASASAVSSENPVVSYDSPGDYIVTLTASNDLGSSQKSMTITVSDQNDNSSVNYCIPYDISSTQNYITNVIFDAVEVQSAGDGYSLSATTINDVVPGKNYIVELSPLSGTTRNFWSVWIDFNQDGDFDDADEIVLQLNNKKGAVSGDVSIPSYANGTTRMRIAMKIGSAPSPCEDGFDGEVEDYMISFSPPVASSSNPSSDSWLERNISVYPNPASNFININLDEVGFDDMYSIHDLSGKILIEGQLTSSFIRVDVSDYPSGIYLVKVINFNTPTIKKIIKK
ncbi:PKD domain-containing protein [Draconibacterium orientale]|uniref:PKD domain-containing protein n=1 Tax=Draconibacterium orientale TaxID=1168034 RepID=UPI002A0A6E3B|nr:PKD domain-containing protein [Draconibacterium orientale]